MAIYHFRYGLVFEAGVIFIFEADTVLKLRYRIHLKMDVSAVKCISEWACVCVGGRGKWTSAFPPKAEAEVTVIIPAMGTVREDTLVWESG